MIDQATLFEKRLSHRNDPQTSFDAARKMVKSGELNRQEQRVYEDIRCYCIYGGHKDFTAKALATRRPNRDYYTIQRRLSGLHNKGKIERIQIGVTPAGKAIYKKRDGCCVWVLTKN